MAAAAAAAARPTWTVSDFKEGKLNQRKVVALACRLSLQGRALQLTQDLSGAQLMNLVADNRRAGRPVRRIARVDVAVEAVVCRVLDEEAVTVHCHHQA